jgi:hypothetical protein
MQIFVADLTLLEFVRRATNSIFRWARLGWGRVGGKSAGMVWGELRSWLVVDSLFIGMLADM